MEDHDIYNIILTFENRDQINHLEATVKIICESHFRKYPVIFKNNLIFLVNRIDIVNRALIDDLFIMLKPIGFIRDTIDWSGSI